MKTGSTSLITKHYVNLESEINCYLSPCLAFTLCICLDWLEEYWTIRQLHIQSIQHFWLKLNCIVIDKPESKSKVKSIKGKGNLGHHHPTLTPPLTFKHEGRRPLIIKPKE